MNLLTTEVTHHSDDLIEEWDMDNDSTVKVVVEPFTLIINYNKGEEAGVVDQMKAGLREFIKELSKQLEDL